MNSLDIADVFSRLHTARSFLLDIKSRADKAGALGLATEVACAVDCVSDGIKRTAQMQADKERDDAAIFNSPVPVHAN